MLLLRKRLVALVTLAAYLLANTHTVWGFAISSRSTTATVAKGPSKRTCCRHCQARVASRQISTKPAEDSFNTPTPQAPACPCCPDSCPVPGGCALCSIAKTPVAAVVIAFLPAAQGDSDFCPDALPLHFSAYVGELMRPPRV
jgi:hypothetical protein